MPTFVGITAVNHSSNIRVRGATNLAPGGTDAPANLAKTLNADTGGAFTTGTKYWKVTAVGDEGETLASSEVSQAVTAPTNEVQHIAVDATAGQYKITFSGQQTADIAFDALASAVQTALEALSNVAPGDITVTGGVGSSGGGSPYILTFGGAYANTNVSQVTIQAGTTPLSGGGAVATPSTTTPGTSGDKVTLDWDDFDGAVGYRIYRGTSTGAEDHYFTSTASTFQDVGATGTAGTPPVSETAVDFAWIKLVPGTTTIVDVDDVQTRTTLNHHSSIGQYVVTAVNDSTATSGALPSNSA